MGIFQALLQSDEEKKKDANIIISDSNSTEINTLKYLANRGVNVNEPRRRLYKEELRI